MIRAPKKYNNAYVQVDNLGSPLYGLTEVGNKIVKLYPCKKEIKFVVLPEYGEFQLDRYDIGDCWKNETEFKYVKGQIVIANGCFEGMKDFKLILPAKTSVKIEPRAFDSDANVQLILPENYGLHTITETYEETDKKEASQKRYTLIADKHIKIATFGDPCVMSANFNPNFLAGNVSVNKDIFIRNGEFVSTKYENFDGSEIE